MNEVPPIEKGTNCCEIGDSGSSCCQPRTENVSSCCNSQNTSWKKGKLIVSLVIIGAAIAVGTNSFLTGNSAQSYTTVPAKFFSAGLTEVPAVTPENSLQGKAQTRLQEIALDGVLDSFQSLDTLAADKDVVFLVLPGEARIPRLAIPKQVGTVANNLWKSGRKIAVFTLSSSSPDHNKLAQRFSLKTFPSVIILGRQGSASAVAGDITEASLYNAFVLASTPVSCCPTQGSESCCPK